MLKCMDKKIFTFYAQKFCLSIPVTRDRHMDFVNLSRGLIGKTVTKNQCYNILSDI